ncbi:MAG: alanine racemase [bacterium]|nr:alanine racemase [bacterium]
MLLTVTPADGIDTPALIVDLGALVANIKRMADFFAGRPAGLRPHFKTHKTPAIAHLPLATGTRGDRHHLRQAGRGRGPGPCRGP